MTNLEFALACRVLLLASLCGAVPARADLHFAEPAAHVGVVYAGAALSHEFIFENQGPEPVAIIGARTSCGCVLPRLPQATYRQGEKGSVVLEVNTLSQAAGPHAWNVTLNYQIGSVRREMCLQLTARLLSEITIQPAALVVFADKIGQHELALSDCRPEPFAVRTVRASSDKLLPRISKASAASQGETTWKISLALADDYPDGRHDEIMDVYTDDPRYRDIRVPVTVIKNRHQRLAVTPSQVELVAAAGQPFPSRLLRIRDEQEQPVHIDQVWCDDPAILCEWSQKAGPLATVRVRAARTAIQGESLPTAIHVRIDQPIPATLTISVRCVVR